ncbi:MAG: chorismate mutase [Rhodopila sp.]|nr:chorismate mutase [Rhodopila sp.]
MSNTVSTIDDAPDASGKDAPPPQDGWRNGGLTALRSELDRIDNAIHDLLIERGKVVEYVARSGKPAAFRPGREASIIRRLLGRHHGALPPVALVRIWRELLAGTTSMQGGFSLAVCDTEHGAPLTQLAREHFGALTPLRVYGSAGQALVDVSQGAASVAVLPYPSEDDSWWVALLHHEPRLHIVGRLPFWKPRPEGFPTIQALVVAATAPDASEQDQSFLGLECDSDVSRARLSGELTGAGLKPESMVLARQQGSPIANVLVEVEGYLSDDDARLSRLGSVLRRPIVLGSYAVQITGAVR